MQLEKIILSEVNCKFSPLRLSLEIFRCAYKTWTNLRNRESRGDSGEGERTTERRQIISDFVEEIRKTGKGGFIMEGGDKLQEGKITGSLSEKVIRNHLLFIY